MHSSEAPIPVISPHAQRPSGVPADTWYRWKTQDRIRRGISRGQLARVFRIDPAHLRTWLAGKRRMGPVRLRRIAEGLRRAGTRPKAGA